MSLVSLKKRTPSVERGLVSVEEFIDEAEYYARGLSKVVNLPTQGHREEQCETKLKRATFTLGDAAIERLNELSARTGIAKSRLIRIWLDNEQNQSHFLEYIASQIK